jgi:hypothetical protein
MHYSPATTVNIFNFGSDSIKFNFLGSVLTGFDMYVTKTQVLCMDLSSQLQPFFAVGTSGVQFSHEGGFCDTYTVAKGGIGFPDPVPGTDFTGQIQVVMGYFPGNQAKDPGLAHAVGSSPTFTQNVILYFAPQFMPGTDDGDDGTVDGFSRFTPVNIPFTNGQAGYFCGLFSPAPPQGFAFSVGQNITVKFQLTTGPNCSGQNILNAVARLSLVKSVGAGFVFQDVQSSGGANNLNYFREAGSTYIFNLSTTGLTPGSYVISISSDAAAPVSQPIQLVP